MNDFQITRESLTVAAAPLVGLSVIVAFASSPLVRFADPAGLAGVGLALGIGLVAIYGIAFADFREPWWTIIAYGSAGAAAMVVWIMVAAGHDARANDRRCLAIQRDMLSARPRRTDAPDLFQALGCRPQGEGSVYAPAKSRNDIKI